MSDKKTIIAGLCLLHCFAYGEKEPSGVGQSDLEHLVEQMRGNSMQPNGRPRSDGAIDPKEQKRQTIVDKLRAHGTDSVGRLIDTLGDSDVQMRRNSALVLIALAGPYEKKEQVDITEAIPALIAATRDGDAKVRAWAAHALAEVGPAAKPAIPALITLLGDKREGPRNTSCMALGSIGPEAKNSLPELSKLLEDPSDDTRMFAQAAINRINAEPATAVESKAEGKEKPKPESEVRPQ